LNSRSLFPKLDELFLLISTTHPGLVFVTESWLHSGINDNFLTLPCYNFFRCDRVGRTGGGVCLWVSKEFNCSSVSLSAHPPCPSAIELLAVKIPSLKLLVICAYIPPNLRNVTMDEISEFLTISLDNELLLNPDLNVMVCGDFNTFDSCIFEQRFSFYNCVKLPTRQNSILDQIWISCNLRDFYNDEAVVGPPLDNSDHQTVFLFGKRCQKVQKIVKLWDFRRSNVDRFLYLLSITDFSSFLNNDCVDELCHIFYAHVYAAMSFVPSDYVTLTTSDKPWITPLLKHLINKRWNAYRCKDWKLYHHFKIKVKQEIMKAKSTWARRQIKSSKNVWKVVREVRGNRPNSDFRQLITEFGNMDNFLQAFQQELNKNFNWQPDEDLESFEDEEWWPDFSVHDVEGLLSRLDTKKVSGSDGVPSRLLREGALWLSFPLFRIFTQSISSRHFPTCWKLADVSPIPKCKKPSITDFRPISLTPVLSKLLERLVLKSVSSQLTPLYGASQHAFRRYGSTESALVKMHDSITSYLDRSDVTAVRMTCLDFSKAFDRVLHNKLINSLAACDVNRGFIFWLKDYLSDRWQRLKVNDIFGPIYPLRSGIPQGSILGPILFACFMGSLSIPSDSTIVLYADDVTLIEPICNSFAPDNLQHVQAWIGVHKMSLNLNKSKQMIFYRSFVHHDVAYPEIPVVHELKVLGVLWNDQLTWKNHFHGTLKIASRRLYVVRTLKPLLTRKELIIVYHSLISSIILYSCSLFTCLPENISNKLQSFQNRAHRIICGKDCLCDNFPPLSSVRLSRASCFFKKCEHFSCHPLHHLIPSRMQRTGHLCLPHIATSRRLRSFIPSMCLQMNI